MTNFNEEESSKCRSHRYLLSQISELRNEVTFSAIDYDARISIVKDLQNAELKLISALARTQEQENDTNKYGSR